MKQQTLVSGHFPQWPRGVFVLLLLAGRVLQAGHVLVAGRVLLSGRVLQAGRVPIAGRVLQPLRIQERMWHISCWVNLLHRERAAIAAAPHHPLPHAVVLKHMWNNTYLVQR